MKNVMIAAAFAVTLPATSFAATVFEDDFEGNGVGLNATPAGWSVSNGTVDIVGPGLFGDICYNTGKCIDLDGSTNNAGRMETVNTFGLIAGAAYTLTFDYTWNYFNQMIPNMMEFGVGAFTDTLSTRGVRGASYTSLSLSFIGDGSVGSIFFDHAGGDNGGIVIDNVVFTEVVNPMAPVPLPAGLPLLLAGLGGLGVMRKLRR